MAAEGGPEIPPNAVPIELPTILPAEPEPSASPVTLTSGVVRVAPPAEPAPSGTPWAAMTAGFVVVGVLAFLGGARFGRALIHKP